MSKRIPNYALYGQAALPVWQDLLHLEWINERGDMHQREIKPHQHDSLLQIVYVRSGEGEVSLENSRMGFRAPCLILLPQRTVHAFRYSPETDGPVITAAQRPLESMARILSSELLALMQRPAVVPLPWDADGEEPIWPLIQLIQAEAHSQERGNVAAGHALLLALLVHVVRLEQPVPSGRPANSRRSQLLIQFRELVDTHFRQHWPLGLYAEALGITPATLGRATREGLGGITDCDHQRASRSRSTTSAGVYHARHPADRPRPGVRRRGILQPFLSQADRTQTQRISLGVSKCGN